MAILVVSSDLLEVLNISDKIVVMNTGTVAGVLDAAEATEESVLRLSAGTLQANQQKVGSDIMSKTKLLDGVKKVTNQREFFIIALVAVVYIVAGSFNENFLSKGNQLALLMSVATLLVLGVGVTPLMIAGCFDMSIASILALSGGLASSAAISGWPTWACIALGLTAGALMGAFNGFFVSYGEMPALW